MQRDLPNQNWQALVMVAHHHLPPLFHLPLLLAWLVSVGQPDSSERNRTSSKTERYPDFALENMSKSCWRPSRLHMTVFPARAARLWRLVTHAWAVIISHAAVSRGLSGPTMLLCRRPGWVLVGFTAAGAPGEATSLPPNPTTSGSSVSPERAGPDRQRTSLPRDGTAQRRSEQCLGTRSHSHTLAHTQRTLPLCRLSLSRSLLPPRLMPLPLWSRCWNISSLTSGFKGNSFPHTLSAAQGAPYCEGDKRWKHSPASEQTLQGWYLMKASWYHGRIDELWVEVKAADKGKVILV